MKKFVLFGILLAGLLLAGCPQPPDNGNNNGGGNVDKSQLIESGDNVEVEYKGTFESGEEFDSSARIGQPLAFTAGSGQMIKGFDEAVIGMRLNQEKTVTLSPDKAYGYSDPQLIVEINSDNIPDFDKLTVGMTVHSPEAGAGVVKEIKANSALIDFNSPLAGKTLVFWIKVVKIEKAA
ncbi:MAG: peptidylprolyl isomerase [Candidatus Diapherotrites archaeon]|nr:peptidylprolyl isomerase [Candidatus Diapherotrites archaeon]